MTDSDHKHGPGAEPDPGHEHDDVVEGEVVSEEPAPAPTAEDLGLDLPDDADAAQQILLSELGASRSEAAELLDGLKRVAAEFDNFRKRTLRQQGETNQRAAERLVVELLPALDSFDAACAVEASTEAEQKLLAGMLRTYEQLMSVLEAQGLETVPTVGEPFDPEHHEAVMSPQEGEGRLMVGQELRRGYTLRDRLVRPALVALEHES